MAKNSQLNIIARKENYIQGYLNRKIYYISH